MESMSHRCWITRWYMKETILEPFPPLHQKKKGHSRSMCFQTNCWYYRQMLKYHKLLNPPTPFQPLTQNRVLKWFTPKLEVTTPWKPWWKPFQNIPWLDPKLKMDENERKKSSTIFPEQPFWIIVGNVSKESLMIPASDLTTATPSPIKSHPQAAFGLLFPRRHRFFGFFLPWQRSGF